MNISISQFIKAIAYVLLFLASHTFADEQKVSALRSAYLFYFSSFIEWPENTEFTQKNIVLCAYTKNESDQYQLKTIQGKALGQLTLDIRILNSADTFSSDIKGAGRSSVDDCHLLYFNQAMSLNLQAVSPTTLLISEGDVVTKGDIHLFTNNNKLMFEINSRDLNSKKFKVSSKLLRLSRTEQR